MSYWKEKKNRVYVSMGKNMQVELQIPQTVYVNVPNTFLSILQHTETIQIKITTKLMVHLLAMLFNGIKLLQVIWLVLAQKLNEIHAKIIGILNFLFS